jgi:sugar phosphate isomerase/epimerase
MKLSLFTVSFAGFWGQDRLSLEQSIDKAAELGFEGVEIVGKRPHLSPLDVSLEDCAKLRKRLEQNKILLSAVAAYTNFTGGMDAAEVPFNEMQVGYVEELSRRAQALGGNLVRIFTSYERTDVPFGVQWTRTIQAIQECCDRASKYDVTIGVQNHHDIGVDTKTLEELLRQVNRPNVIPMFDCWSVFLRGENLAESTRRMASRMQFTTVADYRRLPRARYRPDLINYEPVEPPYVMAVPMGEGELDYKTFFETLKQGGFDGWVSYEMCSPVQGGGGMSNLETYAKRFVQYMAPWRKG